MEKILLAHGGGGRQSRELVEGMILEAFGNDLLGELDDSATLFTAGGAPPGGLAFTADCHVVKPLFFPGGDIGKLSVCGTINDLAVTGAKPLYLSCGFIIEEGFPAEDFKRILSSMKFELERTGARIVTGDTKVVERKAADGIFIAMSGIGEIQVQPAPKMSLIRPGDEVIVSGNIGDHGAAVLASREGLAFRSPLESDCAPVWGLVSAAAAAADGGIRFMRDPTRGGLAAVLNEVALSAGVGVEIHEKSIPVSEHVEGFCELLGLDPLYVANEGKVVFIVSPGSADGVLRALRADPIGSNASRIGVVTDKHPGRVALATRSGGARIVDMPAGDQLPRIC